MKRQKKTLMITLTSLCMLLSACCQHQYCPATCTAPATCVKCGATQGEALSHDWENATCSLPKTCLQCGITSGTPLGHKSNSGATCTEASICDICGAVVEPAKGHSWENATCIKQKNCCVCGVTEGDFADHVFIDATCIAPKTCEVCGLTEGELSSEHKWIDATCTEPKTCELCGITSGYALGHDYAPATCTEPQICNRCSEKYGEPRGHYVGNWEVTVEATKDVAGTRVKKCSVCGEIVEKESFTLTDEELLKQFKSSSAISYDDLARTPDTYKGKYVFFTGKVVQVCSEASSSKYFSTYRVATSGSYNNIVYIYVDNYGSGSRILEDDTISFYGTYKGLYSYTTVMGSTLTIPSVEVEIYCSGWV